MFLSSKFSRTVANAKMNDKQCKKSETVKKLFKIFLVHFSDLAFAERYFLNGINNWYNSWILDLRCQISSFCKSTTTRTQICPSLRAFLHRLSLLSLHGSTLLVNILRILQNTKKTTCIELVLYFNECL